MAIDKSLYRQAYAWHRQWNEAKLRERYRNAGKLLPREAWEQYVDLWQFVMRFSPESSERQRRLRLAEWDEYYSRIQRFEARRKGRGKRT